MTARLVLGTATAYSRARGRTGSATAACPVQRYGPTGLRITPTAGKDGGA